MRASTFFTFAVFLLSGTATLDSLAQNGAGPGFGQGQGRGYRGGRVQEADASQRMGPGQGRRGRGPGMCMAQGAGRGRGLSPGGPGLGRMSRTQDGRGYMGQLVAQLQLIPKGRLSQADREGLLLMWEEEKLAHDVYITLHETWGLPPFANIPRAESMHMEAVGVLLDRYGIDDPAMDTTVGVFQDSRLQQLYDDLIARGQKSVEEAIKVGAHIEELDIADLRRLVEQTENEDIRLVYENLLRGSRNHLRAFARQLARYNDTYEAMHLSQEEFDRIAAGGHERGWLAATSVEPQAVP